MSDRNLLIVFAKPPIPGMAKTRLIPALGEEGAAAFYKNLLHHTLENVCYNKQWDVQLWLAADLMPEFFSDIKERYKVTLYYQRGKDLGERMYHALSDSLIHYQKVALIGTDCPAIDSQLITETFMLLDDADLVISPAEDGGYVQIAARRVEKFIFNNIEWGSERVLQQTQKALMTSGLSVAYTGVYWDIDMPQDLIRLKGVFYALAKDLPPEYVLDSAPYCV